MKIGRYHYTQMGSHQPRGVVKDAEGYIAYHDHPRYAAASEEQLTEWATSDHVAVRNAAATELAERRLRTWRRKS